jgi:hypothetical protein
MPSSVFFICLLLHRVFVDELHARCEKRQVRGDERGFGLLLSDKTVVEGRTMVKARRVLRVKTQGGLFERYDSEPFLREINY